MYCCGQDCLRFARTFDGVDGVGHAMGPQWYRRVVEPSDVIYGKWGLPNRDIGAVLTSARAEGATPNPVVLGINVRRENRVLMWGEDV